RFTSGDDHITAGDGACYYEGSGLDTIRNNAMLCAYQLFNAFHTNRGRSCAFNFGAHLVQQRGEIGNLRLASAVFHQRVAVSECRGHEQILSAGDSDLFEDNVRASEAIGLRFDVAVLLRDLRTHLFETFDVKVDWTCSNRAAAGQ